MIIVFSIYTCGIHAWRAEFRNKFHARAIQTWSNVKGINNVHRNLYRIILWLIVYMRVDACRGAYKWKNALCVTVKWPKHGWISVGQCSPVHMSPIHFVFVNRMWVMKVLIRCTRMFRIPSDVFGRKVHSRKKGKPLSGYRSWWQSMRQHQTLHAGGCLRAHNIAHRHPHF